MTPSKTLSLTTDFGLRDHYVGAMKGVVASIAPGVKVVDITHQVPSFDVAEGAFAIAQAYRYFPPGTVHVVVVDPGVGSERRAIAVRCEGHIFVAPDNGVLSWVVGLGGDRDHACREIDRCHGLAVQSKTFHGRDLFAPAGARLAAGLRFEELGAVVGDLQLLPAATADGRFGRVLHVDRFGNLVTSFRPEQVREGAVLAVGSRATGLRVEAYAQAAQGELFMITGSSGYVELSINMGSAADALGARAGARVELLASTG